VIEGEFEFNRKSKIKNNPETPKRGQGAEYPDRLITKKRLILFVKFFGSNASPQYSLNLTTNDTSVKPTKGDE